MYGEGVSPSQGLTPGKTLRIPSTGTGRRGGITSRAQPWVWRDGNSMGSWLCWLPQVASLGWGLRWHFKLPAFN